jgi:guanine deaminase
MNKAIKEAFKGIRNKEGGPFGAVIVRKGKVIARAHNLVLKSKDPTAHAEITAIRKASKKLNKFDLSDCEIYTSCYPCPMCLAAIYWAKIGKVYYGCSEEDAEKIGFDDKIINSIFRGKKKGIIKMKQIERDECLKSFKEFEETQGRKLY